MSNVTGTTGVQSAKESDTTSEKKYSRWRDEILMAEKEMKLFHKSGQKVVKRYLDERDDDDTSCKFNIFTANVNILQASLYAKIPKITVSRRFNQSMDEVARVAATMIQNAVMQDMEESDCDFDQVMREAVEDRLIPGIGCAWVRLVTEVEEQSIEDILDPITGEVLQQASTYEKIIDQSVKVEHVHWADFIYSPCRTWSERRWVARRVYMDKDGLTERFGKELSEKLSLDYRPNSETDATENTPINEVLEKAIIYEVWDRVERRVLWLSKSYPEILDEKEDPIGLEDFDPCPRPLFAVTTTSNCVPVSDFKIFQDQYLELDEVNNRISLLIAACKVVGVFDEGSPGIAKMLESGVENKLIPVSNWAMFAEKGGVKGAIDWLPLDAIMTTLDRLRQAREDIKGQLYELTGIADIVRGNTKASETLGAQQIKAQFASVRIQKLQDEVARFAQDILKIKAQIIVKHFDPDIILKISNTKYTPEADIPHVVQAAMALLKDEDQFNWRIKVQADSLAQTDYQMQKQEKVEFTNAMATFLQSAATTIKAMPPSAPMVFETLKFAVSGFKGGQELESIIDQGIQSIMQDMAQNKEQAKNKPDPEQQKMQMEMMRIKSELDADKQRADMEMETGRRKMEMDVRDHEMNMAFRSQENQQKLGQNERLFEQSLVQAQQKAMQQMVNDARKDAENDDN